MAKRRKAPSSKNDSQAALILTGLLIVAIIGFFIFSKSKESHKGLPLEKVTPVSEPVSEPVERYIPTENTRPSEEEAPQSSETNAFEGVSVSGARIAFILDDWGQSMANCKYLREIPEPLAISILPGLRHTKDIANCAVNNHKLTMLHLPLEALHNYDIYPPNYIIKTTMSPELVDKIVEADLDQLPSIQGVNNHMGSKATESWYLMKLIFKKIKPRGLFFIDSMTAPHTVCAALADELGLSFGKRDVFLDNVNTKEAITRQMLALAQRARRHGYAVAIGHDRHLTMQVLKDEIPMLEAQGFKIVSIKELIKNR